MKKSFKILTVFLMILVMSIGTLYIPLKAAGQGSVSIGSKSVTLGTQASVNVTAKVGSGTNIMVDLTISYDSTILELIPGGSVFGGGGNARILSEDATNTYTLNFNTIGVGTSHVRVNTDTYYLIGSVTEDVEKPGAISVSNGSVTVNAPVTYSSNNNLSTLSVSGDNGSAVSLSPAFSPSITSYTAKVGENVTSLVVSAQAEDPSATISTSGKTLKTGTNTTYISVTAENGAVKDYKITTTKAAPTTTETTASPTTPTEAETKPEIIPISTNVNGVKYNIISDFSNHPLPSGYLATPYDFNGQSVTVGKGENKLTIMYLENSDGSGQGGFYVYDITSKSFSLLSTVSQPALSYTILPITKNMEIPAGYKASTLTINGNVVDVLIPTESNVNYCLFYGIKGSSDAVWYRYEYSEQTIQKYYVDNSSTAVVTATDVDNNTNNIEKMWMIVIAIAGFSAILLLVGGIILIVKSKTKNFDYDDNDEDESDDDSDYYISNNIQSDDVDSDESNAKDDLFNAALYNEVSNQHSLDNSSNNLSENSDNINAYNSEISSEFSSIDTPELSDEDEDFFLYSDEIIDTKEVNEDVDISEMQDILDDDEVYPNINNNSDKDDDDFEFLEIEDLDED